MPGGARRRGTVAEPRAPSAGADPAPRDSAEAAWGSWNRSSTAEHRDELPILALREAADRLARRDAALHEHLVDLHAPVLRDGEEHVEDLRGLDVGRRLEQEVVDLDATALEIALELGTARTDLVRALEGFQDRK